MKRWNCKLLTFSSPHHFLQWSYWILLHDLINLVHLLHLLKSLWLHKHQCFSYCYILLRCGVHAGRTESTLEGIFSWKGTTGTGLWAMEGYGLARRQSFHRFQVHFHLSLFLCVHMSVFCNGGTIGLLQGFIVDNM